MEGLTKSTIGICSFAGTGSTLFKSAYSVARRPEEAMQAIAAAAHELILKRLDAFLGLFMGLGDWGSLGEPFVHASKDCVGEAGRHPPPAGDIWPAPC